MSLAVARAVDELKRGRPVAVGGLGVLAVELADADSLAMFENGARADLLLSHPRAALLNIVNQRAAAAGPVRVRRSDWMDAAASLAAADPVRDLATPFKGPYETVALGDITQAASAAIRLAKLAGLLPALYLMEGARGADWLAVEPADVNAYREANDLRLVTRARLPLDTAENSEIVAFRGSGGGPEHLAIVIGDPRRSSPVLIRLHSACLTGDVLGSLKCDCGPQMRAALAAIAKEGAGILLYLQQEGRGIGLVNKLRAYALQDQGFDTVDANLRLGFEIDERDFGLAAKMLELLGVGQVRLMTNNPAKVAGLEAEGVTVTERVPHHAGEGAHNAQYLATKRERTGHIL
ncbi:GTP cyclohydrolase II [Sphingoaurantiacus capsulatus]|uniref:GTP cyclohydrolase-2 n=1 Tax=Sphingoaurantiacus capsulatus TaxID=1771310 RepID=A0ABV7XEE5_9SPHN